MSIQRYDCFGPSNNYPLGGMSEAMLGHWVRYADHVAAVAKAECVAQIGAGVAEHRDGYDRGISDERARIYQAVEALIDDGKEYQAVMLRNVLSIIDGVDND